jgi:hypothetical protein
MRLMSNDVQLETRGPIGWVTLDRPKALNALSLEMIRAIRPQLDAWAHAPEVKAVVIRGAGGKAFCSGGDVRAVALSLGKPLPEGEEPLVRTYFREEYVLDHRIHHYPKPYIALVDGISMGGGLGLSIHGSHRVVSAHSVPSFASAARMSSTRSAAKQRSIASWCARSGAGPASVAKEESTRVATSFGAPELQSASTNPCSRASSRECSTCCVP